MITVGKRYKLTMLEPHDGKYDQTTQWVTFTKVDGNLVEIDGHTVLNLASPLFHSVTDQEAEAEHFKKGEAEFEKMLSLD